MQRSKIMIIRIWSIIANQFQGSSIRNFIQLHFKLGRRNGNALLILFYENCISSASVTHLTAQDRRNCFSSLVLWKFMMFNYPIYSFPSENMRFSRILFSELTKIWKRDSIPCQDLQNSGQKTMTMKVIILPCQERICTKSKLTT